MLIFIYLFSLKLDCVFPVSCNRGQFLEVMGSIVLLSCFILKTIQPNVTLVEIELIKTGQVQFNAFLIYYYLQHKLIGKNKKSNTYLMCMCVFK